MSKDKGSKSSKALGFILTIKRRNFELCDRMKGEVFYAK
jgi:hypothetical protein